MPKMLSDIRAEAGAIPLEINWETLDSDPRYVSSIEDTFSYVTSTQEHAEYAYLCAVHGEALYFDNHLMTDEERVEWIDKLEQELRERYQVLDAARTYISVRSLLTKD